MHCLHIERQLTGTLCRINVINHPTRSAYCTNTLDVVDHTDFIISVHDAYHAGVLSDRIRDHLRCRKTVGIGFEIGHLITLTLELATRVEYSLMLNLRGNDVLALPLIEMRRTLDCEVVRFGRSRRPDDLARISINQFCHLASSVFNRFLGLPAILMRSRRGVPEYAIHGQAIHHRLSHPRINRGRGQIIEINRYTHNGCVHRIIPQFLNDFIAVFCTVFTTASLKPSVRRLNPTRESRYGTPCSLDLPD